MRRDPANPTWDPARNRRDPSWDSARDYGTSQEASHLGSHLGSQLGSHQSHLGSHLKSWVGSKKPSHLGFVKIPPIPPGIPPEIPGGIKDIPPVISDGISYLSWQHRMQVVKLMGSCYPTLSFTGN